MTEPTLKELEEKLAEEEQVYAELLEKLDELARNPSPYERDPELPALLGALNDAPALEPFEQPSEGGGLKGLVRKLARKLLASELDALSRAIERQRAFDSTLVTFLNRFGEAGNAAAASTAELQSILVRFAQRIDRLADAKDRLYASIGNQRADLLLDAMDKRLQTVRLGLTKATERLDGMSSTLAITRAELKAATAAAPAPAAAEREPLTQERLDEAHYLAFEDRFRGSPEEIRARFEGYVRLFEKDGPVLDLGCGRGEFLELLRDAGVEAKGIDGNLEMVHSCMEKGLEAAHADVIEHLSKLRNAELGGIFAAQLIEHLTPQAMKRLAVESYRTLRVNGRLVIETVNPRSFVALVEAYFRDLTHEKPVHPDTLDFMLRAAGFREVTILYSSPVSERAKLLPVLDGDRALNQNFDKLNHLLFGEQDYAAIATK